MSRLWKWLFVNREAETLREEISQLQAENAEQLNRIDEWRKSSDEACRDRDAARAESEQTISRERQLAAATVSELQSRIQQLETSLAVHHQRTLQFEQAQSSLNDLVKFRDQQIEEMHTTNAHELRARETKIQHLEQKLQNREMEMTSKLEASALKLAELSTSSERQAGEFMQATTRIQELEQQLHASESRSDNRAEQRSALLRNLAEINRLSSLMTKNELASNSFRLVQSDFNGQDHQEQNAGSELLPQFSTWIVYGEVESA